MKSRRGQEMMDSGGQCYWKRYEEYRHEASAYPALMEAKIQTIYRMSRPQPHRQLIRLPTLQLSRISIERLIVSVIAETAQQAAGSGRGGTRRLAVPLGERKGD
jgi:hypothetical protein